jgi:DNA-directed RNA polymerase specialized sigma24 family protein
MIQDPTYTLCADEGEMLPPLQSISPERVSAPVPLEPVLGVMSVSMLAGHCMREISNYRRGETCDERYCLELLRRAMVHGDPSAWAYVQQLFSVIVRGWMRRHPSREAAYRLDSEENYVAQAFERFWQATTQNQKLEFGTIAAALQYLRTSLNGAIVDTLRAHARHREVALPEPGFPGEPRVEDSTGSGDEVWEIVKKMLHDGREQRLVYLLFHCGLKPREILRFCPQEFSDIHEIYQLRHNIIERLRRNADQIRSRLVLIYPT